MTLRGLFLTPLSDQLPPIFLSGRIPPRIEFSSSSAKGTRTPPRSRGISMKRGFVRAAISRASLTRSLMASIEANLGDRRQRSAAVAGSIAKLPQTS